MTMRIYLAARYSRRVELCGYRARLEELGNVVTSRWLNGNHQISNEGVPIGDDGERLIEEGSGAQADALRAGFALEDLSDVGSADLLLAFTEAPRSNASRGGRHVEMGIALGKEIMVVVIGPRENIFTWLPGVEAFQNFDEFLQKHFLFA